MALNMFALAGIMSRFSGSVATFRQIATRSIFPSTRAAQTAYRFHSAHKVFGANGGNITEIQAVFANFYSQDEISSGGVLSMTLAVEYPMGSGNQVQLTASGQDIITAASGDFLKSDSIDVSSLNIPDGAWIRIKGAASCPAGVVFNRNGSAAKYGATYDLMTSAAPSGNLASVRNDNAATWNARVNDQVNAWCIKPTAILGVGTVPSLFMPADSRSCESGDQPDDLTLLAGAAERFTGGVYPFINAAQAGDKAYQWVSGVHGTKRLTMKQYCQGTLNAMGTNDLPDPASTTLSALTTLDTNMKTLMGDTIRPYMTVTLPPNVGSQNPAYYNTLSGQNPVSSSAMRLSLNTWRKSQEGVMFDKVFRQDEVSADASDPLRWAIDPVARNVTGTTTVGGTSLSSSTGNFSSTDTGKVCFIDGAGTAGASLQFIAEYVSPTVLNMKTGAGVLKPAVLAVTDAVLRIGCQFGTQDGIHESGQGGINTKVLGLQSRINSSLGPICSRNRLPNNYSQATNIKQMMSWGARDATSFVPAGQVIELEYTTVLGTGEFLSSATGEVTASIEYPEGVFTQFLCDGAVVGILGSGASIKFTGTLAVNLPKGARFWVGTWVNWTGTNAPYQSFCFDKLPDWGTRNRESGTHSATTIPDRTMTGVRGSMGLGWGYHPNAIRSLTSEETYGIMGDSQECSAAINFPNTDDFGLIGLAERRLVGKGTINVSVSGDSYAEALVNGKFVKRAVMLQGCTHIYDGYGANDGPLTFTLLTQASTGYAWRVRAMFPNSKYIKSLFDPKATSSDHYTTVAGQTASGGWSVQADINTRIRARESLVFDGYADDPSVVENTPGSYQSKIPAATKVITLTGVTINAGVSTVSSFPAGTFTSADNDWHRIIILGAGTAGANFAAEMLVVNDTTVQFKEISTSYINVKTTGTTVTDPVVRINATEYMLDGTGPHRGRFGEALNHGLGVKMFYPQ